MQPEEIFDAARARARGLDFPRPPEDPVQERVRTECAAWFDKLPEPPVYRRMDDPGRKAAELLIPEGQELLSTCISMGRHDSAKPLMDLLARALEAHLATLCHTAEGRLEKAERSWHEALIAERAVGRQNRLYIRSDEGPRPIYDKLSGASRYDPGSEPSMTVKLVCPQRSCTAQERYKFSPRYSTHRFACPKCRRAFIGYFGEVRAVELTRRSGAVRYLFKVSELGGALSQVEFEETSGAEFGVARRDLLAFLYDQDRELKAVLNLSSSRLLWVHKGGGCFVVTAAYGEGAPQLGAFRAFRDERLMRSFMGRAVVRTYYRVGPKTAKLVRSHPTLRRVVRSGLDVTHAWLVKRGFQ